MSYIDSYEAGEISLEEARGYALKHLEKDPYYIKDYFFDGIITREEARPIALKQLEEYPHWVGYYYFYVGIITLEEARPFALKVLANHPDAFDDDFRAKVLNVYNDNYLNQLRKAGVNVESLIDPDLRFLLDDIH